MSLCCVWIFCLHKYILHVQHILSLWTIKENNQSSWIEVIDGCEVSCWCWELNPRSLEE